MESGGRARRNNSLAVVSARRKFIAGQLLRVLSALRLTELRQVLVSLRTVQAWDEKDLWGRTPGVTSLHREPYGPPASVLGSTDGTEDMPRSKVGSPAARWRAVPQARAGHLPKRWNFWHKASHVFQ